MKTKNWVETTSRIFIGISILSVGSVGVLSLLDPQATMDLVNVDLNNNDALSSIRGVYGGVGISLSIILIYLLLNDIKKGILFLSIFWGAYAISRLITIIVDGSLGDFGNQWLGIELSFCIICLSLWLLLVRFTSVSNIKEINLSSK